MATWIAHLRIAENLIGKGYDLEPVPFVVGNIGPDSGVPNEDWSNFDPPKKVTHWTDENGRANAQDFWDKYLSSSEAANDRDRYSFNIGYYVHLLTDFEWSGMAEKKMMENLYKEGLDKNPNFIWTIKKDWYGLDFLYLSKHPECIFYKLFMNIKEVPDYLDYFPAGAFERQVNYITGFYLGENEETKDNFVFLTEKEMDKFVSDATKIIDHRLSDKLL